MKFRTLGLILAIAYSVVYAVYSLGMILGIVLFVALGIYWLAAYAVGALALPAICLVMIWRQVRVLYLVKSTNHSVAAATVRVPAILLIGTWKFVKSLLRSLLNGWEIRSK